MKKIMFNDKYGLTKAVLEGRKTMTRRIVPDGTPLGNCDETVKMSHYKVGDVVAVAQPYKDCVNEILVNWGHKTDITVMVFQKMVGWANKMFVQADLMPHQIRITGVQVERLQDITDEDCLKEGVSQSNIPGQCFVDGLQRPHHNDGVLNAFWSPRDAFAALIDKVSGKGTWASNPWVFVYEFELVK